MEVLLVMAVLVIFGAIAYPAIDSLYTGVKVEAASDAVRAAWSEAQAHAVSEGRPYRFAVVPGKGNYRFAPDSADYWSGGTPEPDPENPSIVVQKSLPHGIVFTSNGAVPTGKDETSLPDDDVPSNIWTTAAIFLPDGTAQDDTDITLRLPGARPITLHLRALTGVITADRGEEE
jgi:hypothetical protein